MTVVYPPTYPPEMDPSDFIAFTRIQKELNEKRISDVNEVKQKPVVALKDTQVQKLRNCLENSKKHL